MPLGLAVLTAVVVVTAIAVIAAILINKSAEGNEGDDKD